MRTYTWRDVALSYPTEEPWVKHSDALAAIKQARREAFKEAAKVFEGMHATAWPDEIAAAIRACGEGK